MKAMARSLDEALRQLNPVSDGAAYRLLRLPAKGAVLAAGVLAEANEPFSVMIVDDDEVSLLLRAEIAAAFSRRLRHAETSDTSYRLITFDVALDPQLTGFMARVSRALAEAGISILPYAAYSRDHIAVPADECDRALAALEAMRADAD